MHMAAEYGIVDFDWSNAKALWANTKPMNCEAWLLPRRRLPTPNLNPNPNSRSNRNLIPHACRSCPKALMARGSQITSLVSCPDGIYSSDGKP